MIFHRKKNSSSFFSSQMANFLVLKKSQPASKIDVHFHQKPLFSAKFSLFCLLSKKEKNFFLFFWKWRKFFFSLFGHIFFLASLPKKCNPRDFLRNFFSNHKLSSNFSQLSQLFHFHFWFFFLCLSFFFFSSTKKKRLLSQFLHTNSEQRGAISEKA